MATPRADVDGFFNSQIDANGLGTKTGDDYLLRFAKRWAGHRETTNNHKTPTNQGLGITTRRASACAWWLFRAGASLSLVAQPSN